MKGIIIEQLRNMGVSLIYGMSSNYPISYSFRDDMTISEINDTKKFIKDNKKVINGISYNDFYGIGEEV